MSGKLRFIISLLISLTLTLTVTAHAHTIIIRTSDGHNVSMTQMVSDTQGSDLVLIGESHNNKSHHELQLSYIRSLSETKTPVAVGLEMFQSDSQQILDDWIEGKIPEDRFMMEFARNWSLEWPMYRDIFIYARDHHIPMIALNVPADIVKKVSHQGYGSLTDDEKKNLPQGTSCDLNNPHTAFLKKIFEGVPNHSGRQKFFTNFCEAQTLRNSGMALNIVRYQKKHQGTKIVVLTGIWHAIRNAIPEQLDRNGSKLTSTVILPDIPEITLTEAGAGQADYMVEM